MYVNWLCPVWMWIDPDFSSQLALPLAGLTLQHPWRTCCCWPAPPQHFKPLADASSPPALSVPLPSQQLSSSCQLGCSIPMTLVSDPWGCPARFTQHVFVCLCVCVLLFYLNVLALLLRPYCWLRSATHWQRLPEILLCSFSLPQVMLQR